MNTKLKKCCPNCSQFFSIKSLMMKQSVDNMPLFLKCGHSICENCIKNLVKFAEPINCKVCLKDMELTANEMELLLQNKLKVRQLFPVNIYMLGELSLENSELNIEEEHNDEDYFLDLESLLHNEDTVEGQCLECLSTTTKMCLQCSTVLCTSCFNKSHKNFITFRNHILQNIEPNLSVNSCTIHIQKPLEYYCKDCSKSMCMDCLVVGTEKSCKNHNLVSTQEVNEKVMEELAEISPKVNETFRRLTKTAVDIGNLLHNIANNTGDFDLTHLANDVEQHFSKLTCIIQAQKKEITDKVISLKKGEKESLQNAKSTLADSIAKAKSVITAINKLLSVDKMKQANMSALLEDAKKVVGCPWYLNRKRIPINLIVNEEVCNQIDRYLHLDGDSNGTYELLSTEELDPSIEIPPPPPAPVYPPELPKDVRQKNKSKCEKEQESTKSQPFYQRAPTYRSKSGSVSSLNSDSSYKSNSNTSHRDEGYQKPPIQSVSQFPDIQYPKQLQPGGQELVYISHIVTPHNFFVQRACHQSMVEEILKEFRNAVSLPTPSIAHISEGKFYLVFNKADNYWLRCRVVSIDRTNINKPLFHVFCIDFGSTEIVPYDRLRLLPPAKVQSPLPFAINCSLTNCEPVTGSWTTDDALLIQNITDNKQAVMHIYRVRSSPVYSVSVECDVTTLEGGVSLAHALVFQGRARMPNPRLPYPKQVNVTKPKLFVINNDFKPKSVEEVYITHIVSPDNFYVRKQHLQEVYEKLCEELDQNYSLSVNNGSIYLPELEMVCVANIEKYGVEDANTRNVRANWARAVVKELPGRGRARLLLPDCGASVLAHWSALRRVQPAFTKLRALATECHLVGVTPTHKQWSPNSVLLLQKFRNRPLELFVEDDRGRSLGVTLTDKADPGNVTCVNYEMVRHKLAVSFGLFSFNKQNIVEESVITSKSPLDLNDAPAKAKTENAMKILKREQPSKPKEVAGNLEAKDKGPLRLEAKVLHYQSPSLIYVSLVHQQKTFKVLYENIQLHYSKNTIGGKDAWSIGDRCCTICQQSQTWRRAVILELTGDNAKVFYSDFACVETVPLSNLKELTEDFASIGYAAIKCHLCGVVPADGEEWPSLTKEYLKEMLDVYKRVFITKFGNFKDKSMPVELWVYHTTQGGALEANTSEWRCLNHKIIEQGLGIPDKSQANPSTSEVEGSNENTLSFLNVTGSVEEWLQLEPLPTKPLLKSDSDSHSNASTPNDTSFSTENTRKKDTMFISDWMPPEPLLKQEFAAVPTYVDNDGIIYLHDVNQQDTLDLIRKALDVRFNRPDPKAKYAKWSVGEPCIALYYLDEKFYRGRIVEVNNDTSTCLVHYIDYGNEESCTFANLRKSIALYQIPTQAHKCVLNKIQPADKHWDRHALDYIHKSVVEKNCYVKLCGAPIDGIYPIELKYDKLLINDHLVEFEMAEYSDGSKGIVRKYAPKDNAYDDTNDSGEAESDSGPDYLVEEEDLSHEHFDMKLLEGKDWNKIVEDEENTSLQERYFTFKTDVDEEFVCNITVINDMKTLDLNIVHNDEVMNEYEEMFDKLQERANDLPPLNGIFENKACVAVFDEDGRWYRASILEYSERKERIKVKYVDYGNVEIISLSKAKEIDEEFMKLPSLTVPATLYGIEMNPDVSLNVLTKEYTKTFLDNGPFHANVIDYKEGVPCVQLKNDNSDLVYEDLIKNMIFLRSD